MLAGPHPHDAASARFARAGDYSHSLPGARLRLCLAPATLGRGRCSILAEPTHERCRSRFAPDGSGLSLRQLGASSCLCGHYRPTASADYIPGTGRWPTPDPTLVRQRKRPAGWENSPPDATIVPGTGNARAICGRDEREDARDVVARLAVRRDTVEPGDCAFTGVVGRETELDAPAVDERLQVLDARFDIRPRIERVANLVGRAPSMA